MARIRHKWSHVPCTVSIRSNIKSGCPTSSDTQLDSQISPLERCIFSLQFDLWHHIMFLKSFFYQMGFTIHWFSWFNYTKGFKMMIFLSFHVQLIRWHSSNKCIERFPIFSLFSHNRLIFTWHVINKYSDYSFRYLNCLKFDQWENLQIGSHVLLTLSFF